MRDNREVLRSPCQQRVISLAVLAVLLAATPAAVAVAEEPVQAQSRPAYSGELEVYLEPFDQINRCSVTIGLRNLSQADQREATLQLAWSDGSGALLMAQTLRMDPVRAGRYDAKNLVLDDRCDQVARLEVSRANWVLFEGWDSRQDQIVRIDGVEGTRWFLRWDEAHGLFVGVPAPTD